MLKYKKQLLTHIRKKNSKTVMQNILAMACLKSDETFEFSCEQQGKKAYYTRIKCIKRDSTLHNLSSLYYTIHLIEFSCHFA